MRELARGTSLVDRSWGQMLAAFQAEALTGQVTLVENGRRFPIGFQAGTIVGASSPLATDAAVRVARIANLVSSTQVSEIVRRQATAERDEIELVAEVAKLSPAQTLELRRKVIAQRAARTFSIEDAELVVEDQLSVGVVPGSAIDVPLVVYVGARQNLSEQRLCAELARLGSWFMLKHAVEAEMMRFGFGETERRVLDKLHDGAALVELERLRVEPRIVRAVVYALTVCGGCDLEPPRVTSSVPDHDADAEMLAPVLARRVEIEDLPAPKRPSHDVEDLIGVVVDNRYVIEREIATGAMGTLYQAHHRKLDRAFAVKVLHRRLLGNAKSLRRFEREAELTATLRHPNVVGVVDVGTFREVPYLAMEYAEGVALDALIAGGPLAPARASSILRQVCAGLHHAHQRGLIHRDLKPANIIVESTPDEEIARIVDFGIAILREPDDTDRLTTRGVVLGTPEYMAPEMAVSSAIDHRVDLYALGVVAYQLLTGVLPFEGSGVDIALANVRTEVPAMATRAPGVTIDPLLEAFTRMLLAKQPDDRPADAQAAQALLELIDKDRAAATAKLGVTLVAPPVVEVETSEPAARAEVRTQAMWQLTPAAAPPVAPTEPARAEVKTQAMWQLPAPSIVPAPPVIAPARVAMPALTPPAGMPVSGPVVPTATTPRVPPRRLASPVGGGVRLPTKAMRPIRSRWPLAVGIVLVAFIAIVVGGALWSARTHDAPNPAAATSSLASTYDQVGRELADLRALVGPDLTADLFRRYQLIDVPAADQTAPRRAAAAAVLSQIRRDAAQIRDATRSAH